MGEIHLQAHGAEVRFCGNCLFELNLSVPPESPICVAGKISYKLVKVSGKDLWGFLFTGVIL